MNWRPVFIVLVGVIAGVPVAGAELLQGKTVSTSANHGSSPDKSTFFGPEESVVGPDIELVNFGFSGFLNIDYSDTNIRITANSDQPFGYWETVQVLDVTETIADFTSVTVNPETDWAGFSAARIAVSPESITINLGSLNGLQGQVVSLDVNKADSNVRPTVRIYASQQGRRVTTAAANAGPITIRADVRDPNSEDTHSFDWSRSDTGAFDPADAADASYTLDPLTMNEGFYAIVVTVTDSGVPVASARADMVLRIVTQPPVLEATADTDGDGIDDLAEGYGDADSDRIPDYLDAHDDGFLLPLSGLDRVVMTEPVFDLRLGAEAFRHGARANVSERDLVEDVENGYPNDIADFEILGVTPGQSARVVVPLRRAIPDPSAYRKLRTGLWRDFVIDIRNSISTASGSTEACPAPGDPQYVDGLNAGDDCIQLRIEDGGPNDADGLTDGTIRDPGGLAVPVNVTLAGAPAGDQNVSPGTGNILMLTLDIESESGDAELDSLTFVASGTGNDVDVAAVNIYVDADSGGTIDEGDELIGTGIFDADDGTLEILISAPYPINAGTTRLLVAYDL